VLGGKVHERLPAYANINRALTEKRTTDAFRQAAVSARDAGFTAIKCAPFDEYCQARLTSPSRAAEVIEMGIERVGAVRKVIGPDTKLMIDCHRQFDWRTSLAVIARLEQFDPYWIEEPVSERALTQWSEVRVRTRVRLAGGELLTGAGAFKEFIESSGVDVVMPDVKYCGGYCGGLDEFRKIGAIAELSGVMVSPHNPTGPVASLATLHVASTLTNVDYVEFPWGEAPWRGDLVAGRERIIDGEFIVPEQPGLSAEFDLEIADRYASRNSTLRVTESG
jgi:galactonate dehydratase